MEKNNKDFTLQDFEKGLMLAGFISPSNVSEVKERQRLEEYDKKRASTNKNIYFRRVVLAAEIVNEMRTEMTFGRVKFQKLVYLCENVCEMELNERYVKFAAGPFDNRFMHSINKELKKQKWFDNYIPKESKYKTPIYIEMENVEKYKIYYQKYYSEFDSSIQRLLELFRKTKTRQVELIATIYACLHELNSQLTKIEESDLTQLFYNWSEEKIKFDEQEIIESYRWMIDQKLVPRNK